MDSEPGHARMEEVERLPTDDSVPKSDTLGLHSKDKSNDAGIARNSSATSSGLEKRDDVEIVDWDGPHDPENPYAKLQHTTTIAGLVETD